MCNNPRTITQATAPPRPRVPCEISAALLRNSFRVCTRQFRSHERHFVHVGSPGPARALASPVVSITTYKTNVDGGVLSRVRPNPAWHTTIDISPGRGVLSPLARAVDGGVLGPARRRLRRRDHRRFRRPRLQVVVLTYRLCFLCAPPECLDWVLANFDMSSLLFERERACPMLRADYSTQRRPLKRGFPGWIRSPPLKKWFGTLLLTWEDYNMPFDPAVFLSTWWCRL